MTFRASMVQTVTPDEFRGRVSSVEYIIGTGGGPLGSVESGTVAALSTPAISAVSGGLGCVALAALIGLLFPAFARYRAGSAAPVPPSALVPPSAPAQPQPCCQPQPPPRSRPPPRPSAFRSKRPTSIGGERHIV